MNNAYDILACYYDRLMGGYNYELVSQFIKDNVHGKGLDLACGSGKITVDLALSGLSISGVDSNANMLNKAYERAGKNGIKIPFVLEKIEELELESKYDFIISTCDGINYVQPDNILSLFNNISNHLKEGGVFIFDISSEYKLKKVIGNNVFYEDHEDFTYIWTNKLDKNKLVMNLTFFINNKNNYTRYDERHVQYMYSLDYISQLINDCGLKLQSVLDGDNFEEINTNSKRLLFKAGK